MSDPAETFFALRTADAAGDRVTCIKIVNELTPKETIELIAYFVQVTSHFMEDIARLRGVEVDDNFWPDWALKWAQEH